MAEKLLNLKDLVALGVGPSECALRRRVFRLGAAALPPRVAIPGAGCRYLFRAEDVERWFAENVRLPPRKSGRPRKYDPK